MKTRKPKHIHEFKAGRSKTTLACSCGRFRNVGEPITAVETKHTPGPWEVFDGGPDADNTQFISTGIGGRYICETDNSPESKANARLIAAAPELLHAVSLAYSYLMDRTEETEDNVLDCLIETLKKAGAK